MTVSQSVSQPTNENWDFAFCFTCTIIAMYLYLFTFLEIIHNMNLYLICLFLDFISPSGNDLSDGLTEMTAWASSSRASKQTFSPGDYLLFQVQSTSVNFLLAFKNKFIFISVGWSSASKLWFDNSKQVIW